ncbi:MAG: hypothetical protein LBI47_00290 [Puniceicoccales bacterium]|jgi:hypothetical protein|nr:hypothetical protein [Puniceicoccales bacterium]
MSNPVRIGYRYESVQLVDNAKEGLSKGKIELICEIDISNRGTYTYTYYDFVDRRPNMLIGQTDEEYFWKFNGAMQEQLFDPLFAKNLQNKLVDEYSSQVERVTFCRFYEDDLKEQKAVFVYDDYNHWQEVPQIIRLTRLVFDGCLEEIRELALRGK